MPKKRETKNDDFHYGVLVALQCVAAHGHEVIYDEIVSTAGIDLVRFARTQEGEMELSGLRKYGYDYGGDKWKEMIAQERRNAVAAPPEAGEKTTDE